MSVILSGNSFVGWIHKVHLAFRAAAKAGEVSHLLTVSLVRFWRSVEGKEDKRWRLGWWGGEGHNIRSSLSLSLSLSFKQRVAPPHPHLPTHNTNKSSRDSGAAIFPTSRGVLPLCQRLEWLDRHLAQRR